MSRAADCPKWMLSFKAGHHIVNWLLPFCAIFMEIIDPVRLFSSDYCAYF